MKEVKPRSITGWAVWAVPCKWRLWRLEQDVSPMPGLRLHLELHHHLLRTGVLNHDIYL
jgi:hypothetical protein